MPTRVALLALAVATAVCATGAAVAADPAPEVRRDAPFPPQALGQSHTIRIIPEACAYLQGKFTGEYDAPYRWFAARTGQRCQPRAGFVDADKARPSTSRGWRLNDVIRIPNASCPGQFAVVRVWRQPVDADVPIDAQGRPRIYLEEARRQAEAGKLPPVTVYAATMRMEGRRC